MERMIYFLIPVTNLHLCPSPSLLLIHSSTFFPFYVQTHDMFVLFPRFLCSGAVFPVSDPPWLSAAFLHGAILQQSPRGRGREALERLGTDTEQARLAAFHVSALPRPETQK